MLIRGEGLISQPQRIDNEIIYPRHRFALQLKYPKRNMQIDMLTNSVMELK